MRSSMIVRRRSESLETYLIGDEAAKLLSTLRGVSEVEIVSRLPDRAILTYHFTPEAKKYDSRIDFSEFDRHLQSKDMHRMQ